MPRFFGRVFRTPVLPARKPNITADKATRYLLHGGMKSDYTGTAVLLIRGYYLDSQGVAGRNDRNTYDDAVVACTVVRGSVTEWRASNGNVDPFRSGRKSDGRGWPVVQPGVHHYRFGLHRGKYVALKPYYPAIVVRDGSTRREHNMTINGHAGGATWTWSWGCWTVPSSQYGPRTRNVNSLKGRSRGEFISAIWQMAEASHQGGSNPDGSAVFRAARHRTGEKPIAVVVVDEREYRR